MRTLEVHFGQGERYNLYIGSGVRSELANVLDVSRYSKIFVLTEQVIVDRWETKLPALLGDAQRCTIPSGEGSKSIATAEKVWQFLLENGADRKSLLVSIGGGMVTDLGGFVSSTFMRGLSAAHMPTTLLAQVDASIGGKTGVNFGGTKNIIGTFSQPRAVFIDTDFLTTLPQAELRSGVAEILKHGLIRDSDYFRKSVDSLKENLIPNDIEEIIARSCEIKRDIVAEDEKEGGVRKLLNFGHTFGHAFESLSHKTLSPLLHGEAVAVGMVAEAKLSNKLGMISDDDSRRIEEALRSVGLPTTLPEKFSFDSVFSLLTRDKKNVSGKIAWTLLSAIGRGEFDQQADRALVQASYDELFG
ncbi:MAG: 3-dehydroquinate synthase [Bdellovibrionales bacterium]|nr:3-dehydroquinate synthase [Bdellovibrionales bacterium]